MITISLNSTLFNIEFIVTSKTESEAHNLLNNAIFEWADENPTKDIDCLIDNDVKIIEH